MKHHDDRSTSTGAKEADNWALFSKIVEDHDGGDEDPSGPSSTLRTVADVARFLWDATWLFLRSSVDLFEVLLEKQKNVEGLRAHAILGAVSVAFVFCWLLCLKALYHVWRAVIKAPFWILSKLPFFSSMPLVLNVLKYIARLDSRILSFQTLRKVLLSKPKILSIQSLGTALLTKPGRSLIGKGAVASKDMLLSLLSKPKAKTSSPRSFCTATNLSSVARLSPSARHTFNGASAFGLVNVRSADANACRRHHQVPSNQMRMLSQGARGLQHTRFPSVRFGPGFLRCSGRTGRPVALVGSLATGCLPALLRIALG